MNKFTKTRLLNWRWWVSLPILFLLLIPISPWLVAESLSKLLQDFADWYFEKMDSLFGPMTSRLLRFIEGSK